MNRWKLHFIAWIAAILLGALLPGVFAVPAHAEGQRPVLREFIQRTLAEHPALIAARTRVQAARARLQAAEAPLYNPEMEVGYENGEDETKDIGISQTLDWSGKRDARAKTESHALTEAEENLAIARRNLLTELLTALAEYNQRRELAVLADRRQKLASELAVLADRRHAMGDLPRSELLASRLELQRASVETAKATASLLESEERLIAVTGQRGTLWPRVDGAPGNLPALDTITFKDLPEVRQAEATLFRAQAGVRVARKNRLPDPTIGLRGGQDNDETLIGLRLSIPLPILNSRRAEVMAASEDARASASDLHDIQRQVIARLESAYRGYKATHVAWREWETTGTADLQQQTALLHRLLQVGEIGTIDYLVQLNQTFDTETAAIELRGQLWQRWFLALAAAGHLEAWTETL
ncbi:MAG: TolC family protein [Alphaproteobacteria bacterium]